MKKIFTLCTICLAVACGSIISTSAKHIENIPIDKPVDGEVVDLDIKINGEKIDAKTQLMGIGEFGVPVSIVAKKLGYTVSWNSDKRQITLTKGNNKMILTVDSLEVFRLEETFNLHREPVIYNGVCYVSAPDSIMLFGYEYLISDGVMNITTIDDAFNMPLDKQETNFDIIINGEKIDAKTQLMGIGEIGVPVSAIAKKLGYTVSWDGDKKQITLTKGNNTMFLMIGSLEVFRLEEKFNLYFEPDNFDGVSYISAVDSAKLFGYEYLIKDNALNITVK